MMDYQRIKEAVTMEDVLTDYSIPVGRGGWAVCPMHADRHPSLKVYPDGRGYYCFACGSGGDIITFVARMEHVSNPQACALIMARHGIDAQPTYAESQEALRRKRERAAQVEHERWAADVRDVLCAARCASGSMRSEWDYWLDLLDTAPAAAKAAEWEGVIKRAREESDTIAGIERRDTDA